MTFESFIAQWAASHPLELCFVMLLVGGAFGAMFGMCVVLVAYARSLNKFAEWIDNLQFDNGRLKKVVKRLQLSATRRFTMCSQAVSAPAVSKPDSMKGIP